jgi:hypothetical protein
MIPANLNLDPESGFITLFIEGKQYTVHATDSNFNNVVSAYKAQDYDTLLETLNPTLKIQKLYAKYENIEVKNGNVYIYDEPVNTLIASRIIQFLSNDIDCVPIFKFMTRLQNNPSKRAVDELYTFLTHQYLPITASGTFLAYKAVRADFTDKHSGKFDNSVGNVLEMPRNKVDDDKNVGCSYGFHAGTLEYASGFAGGDDKLVLVEIDPADVVSIPTDCSFQKLRTCKYKVVSEYERPLTEPLYQSRYNTDDDDDVDREWEDTYKEWSDCGNCNCGDCACCYGSCDCDGGDEDEFGCMADPDEPKTEIQLELNLDNKMTSNWADERFQYLVMLPWLYAHRRPAVGNALKNFYKDIDDLHRINPTFAILKQFTSDDDAYKIYKEYTNS